MNNQSKHYQWAIIGAGPAGIAALGELLDSGVAAETIMWIDPYFEVGDLGKHWGAVSSNTTVKLFLEFLKGYRSFNFDSKDTTFALEEADSNGYCQLRHVAEPLQWVTNYLRQCVSSCVAEVKSMHVESGAWNLVTADFVITTEKVIMATGCDPKQLTAYDAIKTIDLYHALDPAKLATVCDQNDTVAVFGSSHSSMIIIRSLHELGIKRIINFYLHPIRYAIKMQDWTLYNNTGLKADTAAWVKQNIMKDCLPTIERYLSSPEVLQEYMPQCSKAVYSIGFEQRVPQINRLKFKDYDINTGIIAPGLFGVGIAFPQQTISPLGGQELNVGIYKFMNDIRKVMPLWLQYGL